MKKLILFDIDGTLLISKGLGREAKARTMRQVYGTDANVKTYPFGGKTDAQILHELLVPLGISSAQIMAQMPDYERIFAEHMRDLAPTFETLPCVGAHELVAELRAREDVLLGLVTGNTRQTAPVKLSAAGFEPAWFGVGAYGNESANRDDLPALAIQRANKHYNVGIQPHHVYVVGDTLADVQCARAVGAVAVAVLTGFEDHDDLRASQPDYLLPDLTHFMAEVWAD